MVERATVAQTPYPHEAITQTLVALVAYKQSAEARTAIAQTEVAQTEVSRVAVAQASKAPKAPGAIANELAAQAALTKTIVV